MGDEAKILMPKYLRAEDLPQMLEEMGRLADRPRVSVDFSDVRYSYPLGMLAAGRLLRQFVLSRASTGFETSAEGLSGSKAVITYLMHLGFFNYVGLKIGKNVGEASGSARYVPIRRLSVDDMLMEVSEPYHPLRQVIHEQALQLSTVLVGDSVKDRPDALAYVIREVVRNVFEHSQARECFVCGQRWRDGSVEVAIVDEGIGIRSSLERKYPVACDEDALKLCVQPGVSRITESEINSNDNSGYGLYVLSEFGRKHGCFAIGSGAAFMKIDTRCQFFPLQYDGTFVGLNLNHQNISFAAELDAIIHEGEERAVLDGNNIRASSSSRSPF